MVTETIVVYRDGPQPLNLYVNNDGNPGVEPLMLRISGPGRNAVKHRSAVARYSEVHNALKAQASKPRGFGVLCWPRHAWVVVRERNEKRLKYVDVC